MAIYKERDVLSPTYIPKILPFRENQSNEIRKYFELAINGSTPPHLLAIGPSGTGKTATFLREISLLKEKVGKKVNIGYTLTTSTSYQTLVSLGRNMDIHLPERGKSFVEIWRTFNENLPDTISIFVLDEIDRGILGEATDILYHLSRREKTCIVGLSNKIGVLEKIQDESIRSSFHPRKILFPSYNAIELLGILKERAVLALNPETLDNGVLEKIAGIAAKRNGDARFALDLLLFACDIAVSENEKIVRESHVDRARSEVETAFMEKCIRSLRETQKLLLYLIIRNDGKTLGNIYTTYNMIADRFPFCERLSIQRLSFYTRELALYGFIEIIRTGKGRGKGVEWIAKIDSSVDKVLLESVLKDWIKEVTTSTTPF
jgi:cell division control protein 6